MVAPNRGRLVGELGFAAASTRRSEVAYVLVRLIVDGRGHFLLTKHAKWGDFSLVGGHVEPDEMHDWGRAARRESEEELSPLRFGHDFVLEHLAAGPASWGPVPSRAAGNRPTVYVAQWFSLRFLQPPLQLISRLRREEFALVAEDAVATGTTAAVTGLLGRFAESAELDKVPFAWPYQLSASDLGLPTLR